MHFFDRFIQRPVLSISLSLLIIILGLFSIYSINFSQYPKMTNTVVHVRTAYYGASADLMQGFITRPLEQAIAQAKNIDYISSESMAGKSMISVHMKINTNPHSALADILSKVNSVKYQLPKEAQDPEISTSNGSDTSLIYIAFLSSQMSTSALTDFLKREIKPRLMETRGVSEVNTLGGSDFALRIWLNPLKMANYNFSITDLESILTKNNLQVATGQINNYLIQVNTTVNTQINNVDQLRKLIIKTNDDGSVLHLEDVANVTFSKSRDVIRAFANGKQSVILGIDSAPGANPLIVVKQIKLKLREVKRTLPVGISMKVLYDSTKSINESIDEVIKTIIEAIITVMLVTFLFMGSIRAVIIPIITIPLSLIGVIIIMHLFGYTLNLLTLLAMVLAIGLVVDDAIVVSENIERHMREGLSPYLAAIKGTREVVTPVIAMTLTLVTVYTPIALMKGMTGSLFNEFAVTLAGSVCISGFIALTLSPMMCAAMLKNHKKPSWFETKVKNALFCTSSIYEKSLNAVMERKAYIVVASLFILLCMPLLLKFIRYELAPAEDKGVFMLMGSAPENANLDYVEDGIEEVLKVLKENPNIDASVAIAGVPLSNMGLMISMLHPLSERSNSQKEVINDVTNKLSDIPTMAASSFPIPEFPSTEKGLPIQFVIKTSNDFTKLFELAQTISEEIKKKPMFVYSKLGLNFGSAQMKVKVNRWKAGAYGVTMQDIGSALSGFIGNIALNRINLDSQVYEVIPQVKREYRLTPTALARYYVKSKNGKMIPLNSLVSIKMIGRPQSLSHLDQMNSANIGMVPAPGYTLGDAVHYLKKEIMPNLPKGYYADFLGQARQYEQEGNALFITFLLAFCIIFIVLAMQFESFRDPLVILISVPLAVSGVLVCMACGFTTMNIYTQIGLITLIGLISKHGILICEVAKNEQLNNNKSRTDAVVKAAILRLRPILMTTLSMVAGLFPLLFASGAGASSRFDIGLVVMVGLGIGTLFTLYALPVFYSMIASKHKQIRSIDSKELDC